LTFLALQDAVLSKLNLTSPEARTRVKAHLNQRLRQVQSTLNLAKTRRGSPTWTTVSGNPLLTVSGVAKLFGLYDDEVLHRPLNESSLEQLLTQAALSDTSSPPTHYAIAKHQNDVLQLHFFPTPDAARDLTTDVLLAGTEMDDDTDEPQLPEDFVDVLTRGATADEYTKLDKPRAAAVEEAHFEKRLGELRYFLVKSAFLSTRQQDSSGGETTARRWPYPNLG